MGTVMEIDRPYRTRAYRRRAATTNRDTGKNETYVILTQVGVCLAIFVAVALFKVAGGNIFDNLRQEYLRLTDKKITARAAMRTLDSLTEKYTFLSPLAEGIRQIREVFAPIPPSSQGENSEPEEDTEDEEESALTESSQSPQNDEEAQESSGSLPPQGGEDAVFSHTPYEKVFYPPRSASFAPIFTTAKLHPPLAQGRITSAFGYRTHPITKKFGFHSGMDIAAPQGTPIACVLPGTVKETGTDPSYGNYILVEHPGGIDSFYSHCSEILASDGTKVNRGDIIATVGSTGSSTGYHLHFEIRAKGKRYDPYWLLKGVFQDEL